MKIAIISTTAFAVIRFRKDLILSLISQGHEVYAFATDYNNESKNQVSSFGAIPVIYAFSRFGLNPLRDIKDTVSLVNNIKTIKPDVVFSCFSKPVVFGTLAAIIAKVPRRIGMLEGLGFAFTDQPKRLNFKKKFIRSIQVLLYHLTFPFLEHIVFLNPDDPIDLIENYKIKVNKFSVINGIGLNLDDYPYSIPKAHPVRFIFIGRLLAEKGINEYITAAKIVKKKYPKAEFIAVGDLDKENPSSLTQKNLDLLAKQNIVCFTGYVSNVQKKIMDSSVFVLPSYREGLPRSTQEAMAIGRAIITTNVPGCRETVIDGVNGFLIPPWSSETLSKKMIDFIKNTDLIYEMGRESHLIAKENFDSHKTNRYLTSIILNTDD